MNSDNTDKIYSDATPKQVADDLKPIIDFQDEGLPLDELSKLIEARLVPHLVRYEHPGFHSLYNFIPETGAALGAGISLKYNQGVTNWQVSPGGVMLEELCCKAFCELFELPPGSDATFMYSGTYANQEALYLALHRKAEQEGFDFGIKGLKGFKKPDRLAVVTSKEAHFSIRHAARIMGLGEECIIPLDVDQNCRIDVEKMKMKLKEINKDIFCIVITAGTTSTASIDPIKPITEYFADINTWIHVDAAYGLAYRLVPEYKHLFEGVEMADSITWDPHKQFGVPIPNSLLFVKNSSDFERIAVYSEYFNRKNESVPNPGLKSPPSTRPFTALALVTALRYQGKKKMIERLRAPLKAIRLFAEQLEKEQDIEVMHKPDLGILCIRIIPEGVPEDRIDQLQLDIYNTTMKRGERAVSMSKVNGNTVLRFLELKADATLDTLMETVNYLRKNSRRIQGLDF